MYESAENRSVKILFAVRFIVGNYTGNGYITLIISVMTLMEEICGMYIFHLFVIIIPFLCVIVITGVIKNVELSENSAM